MDVPLQAVHPLSCACSAMLLVRARVRACSYRVAIMYRCTRCMLLHSIPVQRYCYSVQRCSSTAAQQLVRVVCCCTAYSTYILASLSLPQRSKTCRCCSTSRLVVLYRMVQHNRSPSATAVCMWCGTAVPHHMHTAAMQLYVAYST